MAAKSVALILGAGPNVGISVAKKLASDGYKVAITSRKGTGSLNSDGFLSLQADFTKPESIPPLFDAVKAEFGSAPNTIVYNAAALTPPPDQNSTLSIPIENFALDQNVNIISPYAAAHSAVKAWESLPADTKKTFIYTGNILNTVVIPVPTFVNLGVGKSGTSFWLAAADQTYTAKGYRFHYADERQADGNHVGSNVDGAAHAEFYAQLANHEGSVPWHATFVKGKGHVQFK